MNISLIGNSALRIAIQRNLVSFPSQIPAFMKRTGDDTQQRIAHLYFSRGWPIRNICARYGLSKAMIQRLVSEWCIRAVAAGFIQDIHPDDLDVLMHLKDEAELPDTYSREVQLVPSAGNVVFSRTSV
jgi:DNA-binding transcriptional regulator LsrR (DeoR family)